MVTLMPGVDVRRPQRHDVVDAGHRLLEGAGTSTAASCTAASGPCTEISRCVMPLLTRLLGEVAIAQQAAVAGDVDRAVAEVARQRDGVDQARMRRRLAAVDVELIGALVAMLAQDALDLVPAERGEMRSPVAQKTHRLAHL
jgi:hypothetical protein